MCLGVVLGVGARLGVGCTCFMDRRFPDSRLGIGVGLILGTGEGWCGGVFLASVGVGFSCFFGRLFLLTSANNNDLSYLLSVLHKIICCGYL